MIPDDLIINIISYLISNNSDNENYYVFLRSFINKDKVEKRLLSSVQKVMKDENFNFKISWVHITYGVKLWFDKEYIMKYVKVVDDYNIKYIAKKCDDYETVALLLNRIIHNINVEKFFCKCLSYGNETIIKVLCDTYSLTDVWRCYRSFYNDNTVMLLYKYYPIVSEFLFTVEICSVDMKIFDSCSKEEIEDFLIWSIGFNCLKVAEKLMSYNVGLEHAFYMVKLYKKKSCPDEKDKANKLYDLLKSQIKDENKMDNCDCDICTYFYEMDYEYFRCDNCHK